MRVHILAKEVGVSSKDILDKCRAEGLDIKNHMSTLTAGQEATIREWFSEGTHESTVETAERVDLNRVRTKRKPRQAGAASEGVAVAEAEPPQAETLAVPEEPIEVGEAPTATTLEAPRVEIPAVVFEPPSAPPVAPAEPPPAPAIAAEAPSMAPATPALPAEMPPPPPPTVERQVSAPAAAPRTVARPLAPPPPPPPPPPLSVGPAGPQNVPTPAQLRGPRVVRYEAPDYDVAVIPRGGPRRPPAESGPREPSAPGAAGPTRRRVGTPPSEEEIKQAKARLHPRRALRGSEAGAKIREWREQDLLEREERISDATGRKIHTRRAQEAQAATQRAAAPGKKRETEVHEPITVREFCAAAGIPFARVFPILKRDHNLLVTITSTIPKEIAEYLAMAFDLELKIVEAKTPLDEIREEFAAHERRDLRPRPPVVTMLGHVDHGKTSLLDAIRRSRVASGEDGGITQHIGAYHFADQGRKVTFLDTPGHKAFTAMRARGAQMTDVVVLVVAADDGVMPQTVEAISHAKAANVPIVVALNKIDIGEPNVTKIYGQLAEHDLTPTEWGGHTDVIKTAATKRIGIDDLISHLSELSDLLDLKADPTVPAAGTVIEAQQKEGVGPVVRVLVQEGTLRAGCILVCGTASGKVRALLDDRGRRVEEARPSIPVEVWGLSDVPPAGERFYEVANLQRGTEIADVARHKKATESRLQTQRARSLEELFKRRDVGEVPELNVVIKADMDGSVQVLKQELSKLPTDEVRLSIRHAGVGPVNDSDVLLADASDGIIVAFHVTTMTGAKKLAEEKGVDIRHYRVIYEVTDEVKKALEGLLAPVEKRETRATAEVREVFRITKVGVVAGCHLTDGTALRSHLARLIRDGVVIRDEMKIASLRRFKEDVKEVRAGMECGIRLEGFDDIKVGDVIELYEVLKIARTL
jgi:translation initiation factor IF-2